ncbi:MAG: tRNA-dihydrouridine synthase family protein [Oscillospiraceae bacterium]|nr:tRNA-dihydrouridine synthase family protein [Oscillospiraceae bacterium]
MADGNTLPECGMRAPSATENSAGEIRFLFAPMEGITYSAFRTIHHECFPGASEYYTPFIAPDSRGSFKKKYLKELTEGIPSVPQLLVNNAAAFNATAVKLCELGFREINLNAGCPSGTVYAKHKGAGMLRDHDSLYRILEGIFDQAERLGYHVSIKTRMGDHSTAEFGEILALYNQFPLSRLIVHARCRDDLYQGIPDIEGFRKAQEESRCPVVYNGDISSTADLDRLLKNVKVHAVMIGRGAVTDPALFRTLTGGSSLTGEELRAFLDRLTEAYLAGGLSPAFAVERMKTLWAYMRVLFPEDGKQIKMILKSRDIEEYRAAVSGLLPTAG